jgi:hypothetical protein
VGVCEYPPAFTVDKEASARRASTFILVQTYIAQGLYFDGIERGIPKYLLRRKISVSWAY